MSRPKLDRCPFCGDLAKLEHHGGIFHSGQRDGWRVDCQGRCHGMTCYWHKDDEAIGAWNQRVKAQ